MRCFMACIRLELILPGKVWMKNLVTKPKKHFFIFFFFPTFCSLCIPDTGFWNSWLMLLVFLLCCLLFSEGCCWKEDYIIMQIRLYNPEQMVRGGGWGTGNHTEWGLAGCGGTHSETINWGLWASCKTRSCSQTSEFFWIFLEFIVFVLSSANSVYLQCLSRTSWQTNTQENCKSLTRTLFRACRTMLQTTTVRKADLHRTIYWHSLSPLGPQIKLLHFMHPKS